MDSVLAVYDIPQSLKVANPSPVFRRYGVRINLSCWIFPCGSVPTDQIEWLRGQGVTIHLVEFAEQAQEKILELARQELRRHARKVGEVTAKKSSALQDVLQNVGIIAGEPDFQDKVYKKWRSVLARARRELLAAEQCAVCFSITRDVDDALTGLRNVLAAELDMAIQWRMKQQHPVEVVNAS